MPCLAPAVPCATFDTGEPMRQQLNPNVRLTGTGACLPERVVDNLELGELVSGYDASHSGPFHHWVDQVTHVHERRFAAPEVRSSDMAVVAARQALEAAGIEASDLGMVVYASFTLSQILPGDHCRLVEELGAPTVPTFQLMAACAGSIYGLGVAYSMVAAGVYEHVLVIGAETIAHTLNFADPITSIIFGDGAGAAVVSRYRSSDGDGRGMLPPDLSGEFSPRAIHLSNSNVPIEMPVFPDRALQPGVPLVAQALIEMEAGPSVLRRAVVHMAGRTARCLGYDPRDLKRGDEGLRTSLDSAWIVPHQANGRIIDGLVDKLKIAPERAIRTIYRYGNISAASNLIALDHGIRYGNTRRVLDDDGHVTAIETQPEHKIREGDLVLMPSIGGGYLMGCVGFVL